MGRKWVEEEVVKVGPVRDAIGPPHHQKMK